MRSALRDTAILARRTLLHVRNDPEQLVGLTIQPLMFVVLFVYVFGGAIRGSSRDYLQYALPGLILQGVAFGSFATALGLNKDFQEGLIDRFRSLPMSRSAVVGGRIAGDAVKTLWAIIIQFGFGLIIGFRFTGGILGAVGGVLIIMLFWTALAWAMAWLGVAAKSPEAVNTFGFLLILPVTFASSVFAPAETMPGWLQAFVKVNPITFAADAARALTLGLPIGNSVQWTLVSVAVITAIFAPMAVSKYRKRV